MAEPQPPPVRAGEPERLLAAYLAGDGDAFTALVGLYEERLFAFIERMTGDPHLAEDIFQQTFLKVAEKASRYDGSASFSTWLFRIARNGALDELRRRGRRRNAESGASGLENLPDASGPTPFESAARKELAARVRIALAELPEPQREAFLLKEEAELGFEEIGDILGCGKETAKSRFRLAVGKLRRSLGLGGA